MYIYIYIYVCILYISIYINFVIELCIYNRNYTYTYKIELYQQGFRFLYTMKRLSVHHMHHLLKWLSCHKAILVITGREHCFQWLHMDMFINMRQCCGHWKNQEKQFLVGKWSVFQEGSCNFQETYILVILKGLHQQKLKKSFCNKGMIRK